MFFSFCSKLIANWKLYFIRDLFGVLHKSSELQLPRRAGIRLGGPASRTAEPFKGDISVNTADAANLSLLGYLLPSFYIPISFSVPCSASLSLFLFWLSSAFLLTLILHPPPPCIQSLLAPSPALCCADKAAGRKRCNKRKC